jgi:hypothetical protein
MEDKTWSNKEVLHEFLWTLVEYVYRTASGAMDSIREVAADPDPTKLRDSLVEFQLIPILEIFAHPDGRIGPDSETWPGIQIVNAETGEPLSDDWALDLAEIRADYLLKTDPSVEDN